MCVGDIRVTNIDSRTLFFIDGAISTLCSDNLVLYNAWNFAGLL